MMPLILEKYYKVVFEKDYLSIKKGDTLDTFDTRKEAETVINNSKIKDFLGIEICSKYELILENEEIIKEEKIEAFGWNIEEDLRNFKMLNGGMAI